MMNRTTPDATELEAESQYWQTLYEEHAPHVFFDDAEKQAILNALGTGLAGKHLLEIGCGAGVWTKELAQRGLAVVTSDLTPEIARRAQATAHPHSVAGLAADMHALPFPDQSFDLVFGSMVLHHAQDHAWLGREIARVLKPGGRAVFHENSARNPLLMLARRALVGRFGIPRYSSPNEHPLRDEEIDTFGRPFAHIRVTIGRLVLLQMAVKYLLRTEEGPVFTLARRLDNRLFSLFPPMRRWSYQQIVVVGKHAADW